MDYPERTVRTKEVSMDKAQDKEQQGRNAARRNLVKGAALATMFTLGTSAFAENGSLFKAESNAFDMKAVNDIVEIVEYAARAGKDGRVDEKEQSHISELKESYDRRYGEGSLKFVLKTMDDYSKTPGGQALAAEAQKKGIDPLVKIAESSTKKAAVQQKAMRMMDMSLADYEYGR